jgi:hypothetical protein
VREGGGTVLVHALIATGVNADGEGLASTYCWSCAIGGATFTEPGMSTHGQVVVLRLEPGVLFRHGEADAGAFAGGRPVNGAAHAQQPRPLCVCEGSPSARERAIVATNTIDFE